MHLNKHLLAGVVALTMALCPESIRPVVGADLATPASTDARTKLFIRGYLDLRTSDYESAKVSSFAAALGGVADSEVYAAGLTINGLAWAALGNYKLYEASYKLLASKDTSSAYLQYLSGSAVVEKCITCDTTGTTSLRCEACSGVGTFTGLNAMHQCPRCGGRGSKMVKCRDCQGSGKVFSPPRAKRFLVAMLRSMEDIIVTAYGDLGVWLTDEELQRLAKVKALELRGDPKTLLRLVTEQDNEPKPDMMLISGKVRQKLSKGLLINSGADEARDFYTQMRRGENATATVDENKKPVITKDGVQVYIGLCLLEEHPNQDNFVDNDFVEIKAVLTGEYSYNDVSGARRTVRSFKLPRAPINWVSTSAEEKVPRARINRVSTSAADKGGKGGDRPKLHGITGEVWAINTDYITVKSKNEGEVKIALNEKTIFGSKTEPKKRDDFKVGDKVMVVYKEDGDTKCALCVRVPAPRKSVKE